MIINSELELVCVGRYIEPGPRYRGVTRIPQIRSYEEYSEQSLKDSKGYWVEGEKVYKLCRKTPE